MEKMNTFYEFFAGGGMARMGLGENWQCLFSNDWDKTKVDSYKENWGDKEIFYADVSTLTTGNLPGKADLVWGSFPCQDLSLAGLGAGLNGERSGTFWPFWKLIRQLTKEGRKPKIVVLENVVGALSSHGGKDFQAISKALVEEGFRFGALVIDAVDFVPQSRPRLFIIAVSEELMIPRELQNEVFTSQWHPKSLLYAFNKLPDAISKNWIWWWMPNPPKRKVNFIDLIEENPATVSWHSREETEKLLGLMAEGHLKKVEIAANSGERQVGGVYKRTRLNNEGKKVQRAEVRFDNTAGCLRTPSGGSSRQIIVLVDGQNIRSRLISPREAARLMGLPDTYLLPIRYNDAYHLVGDGLVVPVVRYLSFNILEPILDVNHLSKPIHPNVARIQEGAH